MNATRRILTIFVDGLGLGPADPAVNPIHSGDCPCLERLLRENARPIDASLDVPGLPQSATGQTALLTGVNAARLVGRHVEGFPAGPLKDMIRRHNLYAQLAAAGFSSTFANAYYTDDVETVRQSRVQSVTTVAALSAFGTVRTRADLEADRAVYQDITRELLRARGYAGPLRSPPEAAGHLAAIATGFDFTLFEYFQTDRAGHSQDKDRARSVLALLDAFLAPLAARAQRGEFLLLLTSDHGNIEDMTTPSHTANPVPFLALGPGSDWFQPRLRSLLDVTPAVVEWFAAGLKEDA